MQETPREFRIEIQGRVFAGECWGSTQDEPVIALHGWLDNCHSFRPLASRLKNIQLLALDMAGHGHSEHRSADASYHIWDDVREILLIAREMGWEKFSLLGHSRGAMVAALLAAVAPESVNKLLLIEGIEPQTLPPKDAAAQLKKFMDRYLAASGISEGRKEMESMVRSRMKAGFGLGENAARLLTLRNIEQVDGYFYWRTDARLNMPSPQMLSQEAAGSFIQAIQAPTRLWLASEGLGKHSEDLMARLACQPHINVMILPGGHHLHMEEASGFMAEQIQQFLFASS